jgi:hypothetical protein
MEGFEAMKKAAMFFLIFLLCAGCQSFDRQSGTLGDPVPAPKGWEEYINRGGQ